MRCFRRWVLSFLLVTNGAWAQTLVERVVDVSSTDKNPATARTALLNSAAEKASEELIKEIIGEAKFSRNRALIQNRIIKKSAAFLPFSKAGDLRPLEDGFGLSVTVRANLDDLQKLLLENGLFYDTEATPTVLPLVRWVDRVNARSYSWWLGENDASRAFLAKESRFLENQMHTAFLKSGFYLIRPQSLRYDDLLGPELRKETLSLDELSQLSQFWNATLLVQGQVQMSRGSRSDSVAVDLRLTAVQIMNGRVVAELARQFETESGAFEAVTDRKLRETVEGLASELSSQVLEAWKQGSINSQLYRVRVLGRLPLPSQENFKESLRTRLREIKTVRERLIEAGEIVYEIEASATPPEMAKKVGELDVQGTKLVLDRVNEKEMVLKIKK